MEKSFVFESENLSRYVLVYSDAAGFADAESVPGYALPAFSRALAKGIVQGVNGSLLPNDDCTRAQIVTMLYRMQ